jgi:hypothetical protein
MRLCDYQMTQGDFCEREIGHDGEHRRRPPAPSLDRMLALAEEVNPKHTYVSAYVTRLGWQVDARLVDGWVSCEESTRAAAVAAACGELERLVKERREKRDRYKAALERIAGFSPAGAVARNIAYEALSAAAPGPAKPPCPRCGGSGRWHPAGGVETRCPECQP